ncbi:dynactin subunit 6 isoform X4 [Meriones unguiculatus]|uniref:dynactin subunit 6 isoform X4 n=1 Tax=Meriones unguiculatus TaxID=10047 RepID=UPI00293E0171|nr:dynactin subunit 6 isoform X4 [Meriones unguiculatus]
MNFASRNFCVKIAPGAVVCVESEIRGDVTIGPRTVIHPKARIIAEAGPIIIGEGNLIEEQALIINAVNVLFTGHLGFEVIPSSLFCRGQPPDKAVLSASFTNYPSRQTVVPRGRLFTFHSFKWLLRMETFQMVLFSSAPRLPWHGGGVFRLAQKLGAAVQVKLGAGKIKTEDSDSAYCVTGFW